MRLNKLASLIITCISFLQVQSQPIFTKADTLRGSLNENRDWFDIQHYNLRINPNFEEHTLEQSFATWSCKVVKPSKKIQIDLQQPLIIDKINFFVLHNGNDTTGNDTNQYKIQNLTFTREGNIALANLDTILSIGTQFRLIITYHGKPREAVNPPWDGGWIWKKDSNGKPWVTVACQGLGASVWYPCKDHQSDEPENGAYLFLKTFKEVQSIGNGRNFGDEMGPKVNGNWIVRNPINNYTIIPYFGDYVEWHETYKGLKGNLDLTYYALREDSAKARIQYQQVPKMLEAFEYWFGPYPFYEDGYKIIQSPHLGMEHQSAIAYGNKWKNGYLGRDLSGTGWGLKWDFIIVHESGHEWFGNNITSNDLADMWIHEGFTNYSETLFTEYYYGKEAGNEYNVGSRKGIRNDRPIIAHYGVNEEGSGDMYPKAGSMIHNIRHSIDNDSLFRKILIGLNKTFYHKTVNTKEVEDYISIESGINFSKVFDQYLRTTQIPTLVLSYDKKEKLLSYQWKNCVNGFELGLRFDYNNQKQVLLPVDYMSQKRLIKDNTFDLEAYANEIKKNYYINCTTESK